MGTHVDVDVGSAVLAQLRLGRQRLPAQKQLCMSGALSIVRDCDHDQVVAFSHVVPMEKMRDIARAGVVRHLTVNDIVLAAVSGAVRRYLATHGP
jgi:hypothetical protein